MGLDGTHVCIPLAPSAEPDKSLFTPDVDVCIILERERKLHRPECQSPRCHRDCSKTSQLCRGYLFSGSCVIGKNPPAAYVVSVMSVLEAGVQRCDVHLSRQQREITRIKQEMIRQAHNITLLFMFQCPGDQLGANRQSTRYMY